MSLNLREQKMDLLKPKGNHNLQKTFDEDVNVPDIKPDIDKILQTNAQVFILKEEILQDKVCVSGELKANVLFIPLNDKKPIHSMDLVVPFEEFVNTDGLSGKDIIRVMSNIEDIQVNMLNSRKLNLKAIVQFKIDIHEKKEVYLTSDVEAGSDVEKKVSPVVVCQLKESKKDSYKIKDEVVIPAGKPNIMEILWHDTTIQNKEIKLVEGKVNIKGTLHIATLYMSDSAESHIEFIENDITFNGLLDSPTSKENMIHDIQFKIADEKMSIRPDVDGEERVLAVEVDTKVDIKIYDEAQTNVLSDVYCLEKDLVVKREAVPFQKLLCKNQSQTNIKESIFMDNVLNEILQIYYTSGTCGIESLEILEDRVNVEGVLYCKVMFVAADDRMPINVFETPIPFEHHIDLKGIHPQSVMSITPNIHYIGCTMIGEKEIELKCTIQMNALVFEESSVDIITSIDEKPLDMKAFQKIPGIVGYIVKEKETLWDIAKKYRTTVKSLKKNNSLEEDRVGKGDKLIIVKELLF